MCINEHKPSPLIPHRHGEHFTREYNRPYKLQRESYIMKQKIYTTNQSGTMKHDHAAPDFDTSVVLLNRTILLNQEDPSGDPCILLFF